MDASTALPSDSKPTPGGASKFLADLPSRGLFSSTVPSSNPGGMRVYICDHDTSPPEDQLIKTNQTNILIRSLVLKKQKGDSSSKDVKTAAASEASRKRPAEKVMDGRASAKRAATNTQEGSKSRVPEKDLHSLTVERLRALLREKGLSNRGKKDELVARLRSASG
ncbi:hypothetical protein LOK49_LG04G02271 [Camellia lanceoleosa]|uniref:Uncharacterized protein n=1 Tax=Camellia lanceoleosa TaxID=1840588 RepID=A0ACC0I6S2_9ERIC|nr:hypothetical protein LOK49_LG04G02271 [Camellia lanceoleosa]